MSTEKISVPLPYPVKGIVEDGHDRISASWNLEGQVNVEAERPHDLLFPRVSVNGFSAGQVWLTRNGRRATLTSVSEERWGPYILHGMVDDEAWSWTKSGRVLPGEEDPLDLIRLADSHTGESPSDSPVAAPLVPLYTELKTLVVTTITETLSEEVARFEAKLHAVLAGHLKRQDVLLDQMARNLFLLGTTSVTIDREFTSLDLSETPSRQRPVKEPRQTWDTASGVRVLILRVDDEGAFPVVGQPWDFEGSIHCRWSRSGRLHSPYLPGIRMVTGTNAPGSDYDLRDLLGTTPNAESGAENGKEA